jgi:hypothetical protein
MTMIVHRSCTAEMALLWWEDLWTQLAPLQHLRIITITLYAAALVTWQTLWATRVSLCSAARDTATNALVVSLRILPVSDRAVG